MIRIIMTTVTGTHFRFWHKCSPGFIRTFLCMSTSNWAPLLRLRWQGRHCCLSRVSSPTVGSGRASCKQPEVFLGKRAHEQYQFVQDLRQANDVRLCIVGTVVVSLRHAFLETLAEKNYIHQRLLGYQKHPREQAFWNLPVFPGVTRLGSHRRVPRAIGADFLHWLSWMPAWSDKCFKYSDLVPDDSQFYFSECFILILPLLFDQHGDCGWWISNL